MKKLQFPKTIASTRAPACGLDVQIKITLKNATRWKAEQGKRAQTAAAPWRKIA